MEDELKVLEKNETWTLLRYLKGTQEKEICMRNNNTNKICGYSMQIGLRIFIDKNLVTKKSKK
jgi:hypothetical protein